MDGARANDHQQTVVVAGHDVVDVFAGLRDQRLDRGGANRKEANQMFGRGQHGDVLDTFVVGLAGFLDASVPGIAGGGGLGRHGSLPLDG